MSGKGLFRSDLHTKENRWLSMIEKQRVYVNFIGLEKVYYRVKREAP